MRSMGVSPQAKDSDRTGFVKTLTNADLRSEGEVGLAIPPEKRSPPKMDLVHIRETGWNVLVVYWNSRRIDTKVAGALFRDTWVRAENGWRRAWQRSSFPIAASSRTESSDP